MQTKRLFYPLMKIYIKKEVLSIPYYKYICINTDCRIQNQQQEVVKSISLYKREEHCINCGALLIRDNKDLVCGYENKCGGFYGKTSK